MRSRYNSAELEQKIKNLKLIAFDFDGVFTDGKVITLSDGLEGVVCSRRDTHRFPELKKFGIKMCVISSETNVVVERRCQKMKIECFYGVEKKLPVFKEILAQNNIKPKQAAYVGDDINDLECLQYAGMAFVIADGSEVCKKIADYITKRKGGDHAVREICDFILEILYK